MNREIQCAADVIRETLGADAAAVAWVLLAYGVNKKTFADREA